MFTKVKINGKTSLKETLKYHLSSGKKRPTIKGSSMRTMPDGKARRAYNFTW